MQPTHLKSHIYAVLLCCVIAQACGPSRRGNATPESGMEFFAVAPNTVTEVLYSSPQRKLYAYRWASTESFQVLVGQRGSPAEQCVGGEGFTQWLQAISRVPVKSELKTKTNAGKGEWAHVQLRDTSRLEPNEMIIRMPSENGEPVVIAFQQRQFVVDIDASGLRNVTSGCAGLGTGK